MLTNVDKLHATFLSSWLILTFILCFTILSSDGTCLICVLCQRTNVTSSSGIMKVFTYSEVRINETNIHDVKLTDVLKCFAHHIWKNKQSNVLLTLYQKLLRSTRSSFRMTCPTCCNMELCFDPASLYLILNEENETTFAVHQSLGCDPKCRASSEEYCEIKRFHWKGNCSRFSSKQLSRITRLRRSTNQFQLKTRSSKVVAKDGTQLEAISQLHHNSVPQAQWNHTQQLVPTYRLPTIHTIPARTILISPSNLIPEQGPDRIFDESTFWTHKYHVIQARCGVFQIMSVNGIEISRKWNSVEQFNGDQVLRRQVRYLSTLMQPEDDAAVFEDLIHLTRLTVIDGKTTRVRLILPVIFTRIRLQLFMYQPLVMSLNPVDTSSGKDRLDSLGKTRSIHVENLLVQVKPPERDQSIYFTILSAPKHGHLYLNREHSLPTQTSARSASIQPSTTNRIYLGVNSQFTQENVRHGQLFYTFRRVLDEQVQLHMTNQVTDGFDFRVHVPGAQLKAVHHFKIVAKDIQDMEVAHIWNHASIRLIHEPSKLYEGGVFTFRPDVFYARLKECTPPFLGLYFQLLSLPNHGVLQMRKEDDLAQAVIMKRFIFYSIKIIEQGMMVYRHDGSETITDIFQYQFVCQGNWFKSASPKQSTFSLGEPVLGTFRFNIIPVNDNPPVIHAQPLFVLFNQTTPISARWIAISDRDHRENAQTHDPKRFPITWEVIPHHQRADCEPYPILGQFVNPITSRRVDTFTVDDVIRGNLSFQHLGSPKGIVRLHVTDGKFYTNVNVFINVSRATFLILRPKSPELLSPEGSFPLYFEVLTNVALTPRKISVTVIGKPCYGLIEKFPETGFVTEFTYEDVLRYRIRYRPLCDKISGCYNTSNYCTHNYSIFDSIITSATASKIERIILAVYATDVSKTWHETISLEFYFRLSQSEHTWKNLENITSSASMNMLEEALYIGTKKHVPLKLRSKFETSQGDILSGFLYELQKPPLHGQLTLETPSFILNSIGTFTLADILASRVVYELNYSDELAIASLGFQDCFVLNVVCPRDSPLSLTWANGNGFTEKVCVHGRFDEFKFQTNDLMLGSETNLSLTDANLQPTLSNDALIRHDQPSGHQNTNDTLWRISLQDHFSSSSREDFSFSYTNMSDEKLIFVQVDEPKYGQLVSKRLNRPVQFFTSEDIGANDVFYVNKKQSSNQMEDVIKLMAFRTLDETSLGSEINLKIYLNSLDLGLRLSKNRSMIILVDSFVVLNAAYLAAGFGSSNLVRKFPLSCFSLILQ